MTTRSLGDTIGRRLWATGLVLAVAAALVAAMFLSGPATSADATASTPTDLTRASTDDRSDLREDLESARALEGRARRDALAKIRSDATAGVYGDTIADRLERRADRRAALLVFLPDALRTDLERARDAEPADRAAMLDDIRDTALDGGYGPEAKEAAEILKEHRGDGRRAGGRRLGGGVLGGGVLDRRR